MLAPSCGCGEAFTPSPRMPAKDLLELLWDTERCGACYDGTSDLLASGRDDSSYLNEGYDSVCIKAFFFFFPHHHRLVCSHA